MIVHGSVSPRRGKRTRKGAKFFINVEQHSHMLQFETVQLNMVELSVQVSDQEVQELRDNTLLPISCITNKECVYGLHTDLITGTVNNCKLQVIRTIETSRDDNCDVLIHHTNYPEIN